MVERDLQRAVIDLAHVFGWKVAHFRPAVTRRGWRTAVQADGKGWPDLMLARGPRLLVVELKVGRNELTAEQRDWIARLRRTAVEVYIWHESDLTGPVVEALR